MLSPLLSRNDETAPSLIRAIGLMSGTSLDGVDAALIETDGGRVVKPLGFVTLPYPASLREQVRGLFGRTNDDDGAVRSAAHELTNHHLAAILSLLVQTGYQADEINVIGFHGQTITHLPDRHFTWQIGDPEHLVSTLGRPVVFDFRVADVEAGGQGAPLIPIYHQALAAQAGIDLPVAILNIGGVANITYIGADDGELIAFDTGPGNALIDDMVLHRTGDSFDKNGRIAQAGHADQELIDRWMAHRYFTAAPPKSLDRNDFAVAQNLAGHTTEDAVATLTAFTVESVAASFRHLPALPRRLLVAGGGRHNGTIMAALSARLNIPVEPVDKYRLNGDAMEAEGFAYMAVRRMKDLPISFPGTTGAPYAMPGGRIYGATG